MESSNVNVSFYFELLYKEEKLCFQEVSGISIRLEIENDDANAENNFKNKLPAAAKYETLVLKEVLFLRIRIFCHGVIKYWKAD